jgi:pyruvate/2-oxoglutarate dehydrogenase complex dihydrolipoamide dehydrogenase (E3) component
MAQHFDAVVIGTGQGGSPLAVRLAQSGKRTAVIERHLFGGTCVNVGCTPTKTYVASARAAHVARTAAQYGVMIGGDITIDMARVKARKDEVIGGSRTGIEAWLRGTENVTVFKGHARFTGPHALSIEAADGSTQDIGADLVFINTGTRAAVPEVDGLERVPYLTNSTILELTEVPEHLVIVGASYIALEFGQMFRRFGSRVTLLVRGKRILTRERCRACSRAKASRFGSARRSGAWSSRRVACASCAAMKPSTPRICFSRPDARRTPTISV